MNTNLLPNSKLGWFCLGICFTGAVLKICIFFPGLYSVLFVFLLFYFCIYLLSPPYLTKYWDKTFHWALFASFLFLLFSDTNQISKPKQTKPFFREYLLQELNKSPLSAFESRIVFGLVSGSTKEIPKDFKELAKESGILHLFAASGLHLGIFIGSLQFIGNLIFTKHRWISILISLGIGFLYLYVLNFPVSFVRAYLFALFTLGSSLFYRRIAVSDLLIISSAIIAFFFFSDFLSVGFLLSFSAVFGIFYLKPSLDRMLFKNSKSLFKDNFTLTIVCSLCSFPVLVTYFKAFSYGGIWINFCLVPIAGILLPSLYITLFVQSILPNSFLLTLGGWIWTPASFILSLFLKFFQSLSDYERAYKQWKGDISTLVCLSIFLILLLWVLHRFNLNQKRITNLIVSILLGLFFPFSFLYQNSDSVPFFSQFGKGFFTFSIENSFFLYGVCSPNKRLEMPMPHKPIKHILFESETCLQNVLRLKKKHKIQDVVWYDRKLSPFIRFMEKEGIQIQSSIHLGQNLTKDISLFRYDGNPKEILSLLHSLKEAEKNNSQKHWQGILVLDFPPWKKKEAKEWVLYQKLLGISKVWKIIIVEDHFEIPLLHYLTNPNLL
ncbi:ComEC/Rec2 family competence protein [Leptospira sp. WS39.C2]